MIIHYRRAREVEWPQCGAGNWYGASGAAARVQGDHRSPAALRIAAKERSPIHSGPPTPVSVRDKDSGRHDAAGSATRGLGCGGIARGERRGAWETVHGLSCCAPRHQSRTLEAAVRSRLVSSVPSSSTLPWLRAKRDIESERNHYFVGRLMRASGVVLESRRL